MNSCYCNYCGTVFAEPFDLAPKLIWPGDLKISGRLHNDCVGCGATVVERQLKFYFEEMKLLQGRTNIKILHFNPEFRFINYLGKFQPEIHILAMASTSDRRFEAVNIEDMPYCDDVFDLVIANYQLESVVSVEKTLNELNRVLKPDGLVLLQTSFSHVLENTWEDAGLDTKQLRENAFGDGLHRRLFGIDIFQSLSQRLNSNVLQFSQLATKGNLHALDVNDPFMLFRKKHLKKNGSHLQVEPSMENEVAVSIMCVTYNHAAFIEQALTSFIEQKTNFRFEIVIGEDCSTDDTLKILNSWIDRYPQIIRLVPGGRNMGGHLNWDRTYRACTGRYIAYCEGDDRWADPLKLQKQFDYMEKHPNCAMTYGNVQAQKDGRVQYDYTGGAKCDLTAEVLQLAPPINTMTVMFRNVLGAMPPEKLACGAGDMFIWSLLGQYGYGHYMPSLLPSVYNLHAGGAHSLTGSANQHLLRLKTFYAAFNYYARIGRAELAEYFLQGARGDANHIATTCTTEQSHVLLGTVVSDMSQSMRDVQTFDTSALSRIIEQVLSHLECSNVH